MTSSAVKIWLHWDWPHLSVKYERANQIVKPYLDRPTCDCSDETQVAAFAAIYQPAPVKAGVACQKAGRRANSKRNLSDFLAFVGAAGRASDLLSTVVV